MKKLFLYLKYLFVVLLIFSSIVKADDSTFLIPTGLLEIPQVLIGSKLQGPFFFNFNPISNSLDFLNNRQGATDISISKLTDSTPVVNDQITEVFFPKILLLESERLIDKEQFDLVRQDILARLQEAVEARLLIKQNPSGIPSLIPQDISTIESIIPLAGAQFLSNGEINGKGEIIYGGAYDVLDGCIAINKNGATVEFTSLITNIANRSPGEFKANFTFSQNSSGDPNRIDFTINESNASFFAFPGAQIETLENSTLSLFYTKGNNDQGTVRISLEGDENFGSNFPTQRFFLSEFLKNQDLFPELSGGSGYTVIVSDSQFQTFSQYQALNKFEAITDTSAFATCE